MGSARNTNGFCWETVRNEMIVLIATVGLISSLVCRSILRWFTIAAAAARMLGCSAALCTRVLFCSYICFLIHLDEHYVLQHHHHPIIATTNVAATSP